MAARTPAFWRRLPLLLVLLRPGCAPDGDRTSGPLPVAPVVQEPPSVDVTETQLLEETNRMRRDPAAYAEALAMRRSLYDGKNRPLPDGRIVTTQEGWPAVEEAIEELRRTPPLGPVQGDSRLTRCAREHVEDIGPRGLFTHEGSSGEPFPGRLRRYVRDWRWAGETIHFGSVPAEEVIRDFVIDDGVPDRGHRRVLLDPRFGAAGAACGPHAVQEKLCVIDFIQP